MCSDLFYGPEYELILVFPVCMKEYIVCFIGCWINVSRIKLADGAVQNFCIFTDFYLLNLSIVERGVLKSPAVIVDLSVFFLAVL